jgi:hypothetical protein
MSRAVADSEHISYSMTLLHLPISNQQQFKKHKILNLAKQQENAPNTPNSHNALDPPLPSPHSRTHLLSTLIPTQSHYHQSITSHSPFFPSPISLE